MCKKKFKRLAIVLSVMTIVALLTSISGCTYPSYSRNVTYSYDADGNLLGTTVNVSVLQRDPESYPLRHDFRILKRPFGPKQTSK